MKKKRYTGAQFAFALRQAEPGLPAVVMLEIEMLAN
jgi:hypothetical protein